MPTFDDDRCEMCGEEAGQCVCPVCPTCGVQGDPNCVDLHGLDISPAVSVWEVTLRVRTARTHTPGWLAELLEPPIRELLRTTGLLQDVLAVDVEPAAGEAPREAFDAEFRRLGSEFLRARIDTIPELQAVAMVPVFAPAHPGLRMLIAMRRGGAPAELVHLADGLGTAWAEMVTRANELLRELDAELGEMSARLP